MNAGTWDRSSRALAAGARRLAGRRAIERLGLSWWLARELRTGERELRLLPRLVGPSCSFVDVGANVGLYSLWAIRNGCRVVAFEPVPDVAENLQRRLGRGAVVHQLALSDAAGTAMLGIPQLHGHDITTRSSLVSGADPELPHRHVAVRVDTLDSFALAHVGLIKIDVEGNELAVLRGSLGTIDRCRPSLIIEIEEARSPGCFGEIRRLLAGRDYAGWWLDERAVLRPVEEFDVGLYQACRPRYGERRDPGYVNNFIWLPRERPIGAPA